MKKKNRIWICSLFIMSMLLVVLSSCKKDTIPELTTASVSSIKTTTATCVGIVNSDGGADVTAYGVCWSTGSTPTISDSKTTDGTGTGSFTSAITGLTPNTTYYVCAYATNSAGTGYGNIISFTTTLAIGDSYGGGIIFYISGQHGLIAASSDQGIANEWGCYNTLINGAYGIGIGTGNQNTLDIVNGCTTINTAAYVCADLTLNGYSDWFLPSKDELAQMFLQKNVIGGFANSKYWSSTQDSALGAEYQDFSNGSQSSQSKYGTCYVRAIRAF